MFHSPEKTKQAKIDAIITLCQNQPDISPIEVRHG